jgi:predicted RNase H-like HicB family nuclease
MTMEQMTRPVNTDHYTYRVWWSAEDDEYVATCLELPSLSWLAKDQIKALKGVEQLVRGVVADLIASGDHVPEPLGERSYSGRFNLRLPPELHRELAVEAAEHGISLNRLVSDRLAHR